jgi:hypothetical protein
MKAHAVPQDIMNLEFKLFGNFLSLREFIFIAVGVALAWFFYFLMQKGVLPGLLAIPAILLFGLGGIMMGLVPIQDRPLDQWLVNYIAAIRKPTQRIWKKPGFQSTQAASTDSPSVITKNHVVTPPSAQGPSYFTAGVAQPPKQADTATIDVEKNESADITRIQQTIAAVETGRQAGGTSPTAAPARSSAAATAQPQPSATLPAGQTASVSQPASAPVEQTQSNTASATLDPGQDHTISSVSAAPARSPAPDPSLNNIEPHAQMAAAKKSKMIRPEDIKATTPPPQPVPQQNQPHPSASPDKTLEIDDNNIKNYATTITGLEPQKNTINIVVKDANGLILPGVVCVIKNPQGDPVRAAISNVLGQVLNNVPLKDGVYKINLSKQGYVFPEITRTLKGNIYPPIEIKSL